jgi:hypothetical protein
MRLGHRPLPQHGTHRQRGDAHRYPKAAGVALVQAPRAIGFAVVNLHTWIAWGSGTHWNAFVANLEMLGKGTFFDPWVDDAVQFPIAARDGLGPARHDPDLITPRLAGLHLY